MPTSGSPRELVLGLAVALRDEIAPELGDHAGRAHSGAGKGGDITFAFEPVVGLPARLYIGTATLNAM